MSTLVDTGAWYALADTSDRHHVAARRFFELDADRAQLVTTDVVVAETFALVASRQIERARLLGRAAQCADPDSDTRRPGSGSRMAHRRDLRRPVVQLRRLRTFAIMERLGIEDAFAFDSHFLVYRFRPRATSGLSAPAGIEASERVHAPCLERRVRRMLRNIPSNTC